MTFSEEIARFNAIFIDTAPIIYYIEAHPQFGPCAIICEVRLIFVCPLSSRRIFNRALSHKLTLSVTRPPV